MSGAGAWNQMLTQPDALTGEDLLRLWAENDREVQTEAAVEDVRQEDAAEHPVLRLTDADVDRVAWALCRRLLDAAGNM